MRQIKSLLMLIFASCLLAQPLTAQVRYMDEVFDDITVTRDVTYATNISILTGAPAPLELKMDVYAPAGDDATDRPVVAYFHTGSFLPQYVNGQVTGGRQDSTVVEICTRLAKLGYVAISATYRQGWLPLSEDQNVRTSSLLQAAYRGIHDARSLVRYLRKTVAEDSNPLGIDDDKIVLWGQGTGGYISLGSAFLDDYSEIVIEKFIDTNTALPYVLEDLHGNVYGTNQTPLNLPNYPSYSSDFAMAVNMGGALGDINWIDGHENEPPTIGFHVLTDPFAPYGDGSVIVPTTDEFVVSVSGTGTAVAKANEVGTNDVLAPALDPTDPLNAYVNALKGLVVDLSGFGHSAQTQVGVDHVYPFLMPNNRPGSGPWDWWNKQTLDFIIPVVNAQFGTDLSSDQLHNDGLLTNPDMSAEKARAYIDTIMAYYIPRAAIALDLMQTTVWDVIAGSEDHTTLETAISAAGLDETLRGEGPFTVFAPTDAAFGALPTEVINELLMTPEGELTQILLYHVLSGKVLSTDLTDGMMAMTVNGKEITVTINDDGVFINDAKVIVADLEADNGVVHVIDAVLLPPKQQVDLPITFDDADVDYDLVDFGGNVSAIVVDPTDETNMVGQATKTAGAELWAGTTMGDGGLANAISFSAAQTQMTVRVWSPDAGTPIRLKAEDAANAAISVETEATTTMAGEWETLTFNFNNQVAGTAPINLANTYDKLSIFFNFGTTGADAGEKTYYWDDVELTPLPDSTVVDIIVASPDHGTLETAVIAAGLDDDLSGFGPFTVFAPTDAAFEALPAGALDALLGDPTGALAQVLLYHVLGAEVLSTDLMDGQMAATLQGGDITVTINDDGVFINNAKVTVADLRADNGVVHVIDAVLLPPAQIDLPITFDDANVNYDLVDFGGNVSAIVVDPTDESNMVGQATKTAGAESWAGTTMGGNGLANPVPFSASQTQMTVRVWSPDAGTPIRLKAENATNPAVSVETEAVTTVAMDWDTLTFNFSNQAQGTAALNLANTYDKISIFFNFGTTGADAGEKTYYWDDVQMAPLPDSTVVDIIVASPDHGILETAVIAAGLDDDLSGAGPFTVFAPTDAAFMALGQETIDAVLADQELLTNILLYHVLGAEVLSTDLTDGQTAATLQGGDITVTINDDGVFINNAKVTVADLRADNGVVHVIDAVLLPPAQIDLPITFDDANVNYDLVDFGGNVSAIVVDPTDANNMVGQATKTAGAEPWAGTTMGGDGLANAVPFSETATSMTVRVWSPDAGTPIRLKVEDATNAGISVETEATTTVAMDWETLTFDFSNEAVGTAPINLANTYDKLSIFFNFGATGAEAGEKTYYWDDVLFGTTNLAILPAAQNGIKVFPNPANTQVNVEFTKALNEVVQMRIIDLSGRVLKRMETNDQISQINTNDLIPGAYFLRIDSKSASYYQKIMIAR